MNAGVLQFALGLNAGGFLGPLGSVAGRVTGLIGGMVSLGSVVAGVWSAIERGGHLQDLKARVGGTVGELYQLQEAFKEAGLGADAVGPMILKLSRSLAGSTEAGEKTADVLGLIGLNIDTIRGMNAPARILAIATALKTVGRDDAAGIAGKIFGREAWGNIAQISGDLAGFKAALAASAREAAVFQRNAAAFEKLGDTLGRLKSKAGGLFAGLAEGATPGIQAVMDKLGKMDLTGMGLKIGNQITVAFEAIKLGEFGQYWTLILQSGVQEASNLMMNKIAEWSDALDKDKSQGKGGFWGKTGRGALGVGQGLLGLWDQAGAYAGIPGQQEQADKRFGQAQGNFEYAGIADGILSIVADAATKGMAGAPNDYKKKLEAMNDRLSRSAASKAWLDATRDQDTEFLKNAFKPNPLPPPPAKKTPPGNEEYGRPDFTSLEKMGFGMSGLGNPGLDHQRNTAANTARMVAQNDQILSLMGVRELPPIDGRA